MVTFNSFERITEERELDTRLAKVEPTFGVSLQTNFSIQFRGSSGISSNIINKELHKEANL